MKNLHQQFVQFGRQRFKLTNEMLVILPEIYKSRIWKKYANSIIEYAGKYGGLPKSTVLKRLRLEKHLIDKPLLKEVIKEVGVNKVAMIATLVTPENEEDMVDKLKNMSAPAIQTLSKEKRNKPIAQKITIELDEEMTFQFLKIKKEMGNASNREVMQKILKKVSSKRLSTHKTSPKKVTRYIPAEKRREDQCSYKDCNKPVENYHHQNPYSESHSHDSVIPLCKSHHEFAHNGLYESKTLRRADILYRKFKTRNQSTSPN